VYLRKILDQHAFDVQENKPAVRSLNELRALA